MTDKIVPFWLHKANLELHLQIRRLLVEQRSIGLQLAAKVGEETLGEMMAEIEGVRQAENWQTLAMLPAETFWRVLRHRTAALQEAGQLAIRNQTTFTQGLKEALETWQKVYAIAFESAANKVAAPNFPDIAKIWGDVPNVLGGTAVPQNLPDFGKLWCAFWNVQSKPDQPGSGTSGLGRAA